MEYDATLFEKGIDSFNYLAICREFFFFDK